MKVVDSLKESTKRLQGQVKELQAKRDRLLKDADDAQAKAEDLTDELAKVQLAYHLLKGM